MRYIKIARTIAALHSISEGVRLVSDTDIIINEKDLINQPELSGTLEDRVALLDGEFLSNNEVKQLMNKGGYNYGL